MRVQVLTKAGTRAVRDFDILARNGWKFGSTITGHSVDYLAYFEPHTKAYSDRKAAILEARKAGIFTWVSLEPVINAVESLSVLLDLLPHVDYWKIGKLNHNPEIENKVDWADFLSRAQEILGDRPYLIKKDLRAAAEKRQAGLQPTTNASPARSTGAN